MVNPKRILFARERRGLTQTKLAQGLEVDPKSIRDYENGKYSPDREKLKKLAEILNFPIEFFFKEDPYLIAEDTASFRSLSRASNILKKQALGAGVIAFEFNDWLEKNFKLPAADLPDLSDLDPETAAATLRRIWGIGELPIGNFIHFLEAKGVRVFSLAIEAKEIDAFSVWRSDTPFVFLNTLKTPEHSRFDAAHELGHLVRDTYSMKIGHLEKNPNIEKEANEFASAFLMPKESMIAIKPFARNINFLLKEKKKWGVSLAAFVYRLNKLGAFSEWEHRNLCIFIAKNGYRTKEPNPLQPESSLLLKKVFDLLNKESINKADIANSLNVYREELEKLTFSLTLSVLSSPTTGHKSSSTRKNKLFVI